MNTLRVILLGSSLLLASFASGAAHSETDVVPPVAGHGLRILNFNTMCSVCDLEGHDGPFSERLKNIGDTVRRQNPDLASFQEFSTPGQVNRLLKMLHGEYLAIFDRKSLIPTTDSVLFVRKDRFRVIAQEGVWLGSRLPHFSFGWKVIGIPRRFEWVQLQDLETGQEFIFAGSHFDNHFENKDASAAYVQSWSHRQALPVIFAGDTNLRPEFHGYGQLVADSMRNTFDEHEIFTQTANSPFQVSDNCEDDEAIKSHWPMCRIDHVLISRDAPWRVSAWGEDLYRYYQGVHFASDHRAVIVDLTASP